MHDQTQSLSGPDFLDAVADAELSSGHPVNADIYRQRARDWRQLERDYEQAETRIASQQRALDNVRRAAGAITPTTSKP